MDKYDYVTATIEEEKDRLSGIILYLEENNLDKDEYQERYNLICKYLNAKKRYFSIKDKINDLNKKINNLNELKDEYEVDNILYEDMLLNKFHEDTSNRYRNMLYDDIDKEEDSIKNILYLMFNKESGYTELIIKRNRLRNLLDKDKYPNTTNELNKQSVLIEKEDSLQDEILLIENDLKIEKDKLEAVINSVMDTNILKILYEFCIIMTYDINKVDKNSIFNDNKNLLIAKEILDK